MTRGQRANVGIGQVLAELRDEFPDISPSKIRFLEAEGLIQPARAESGYRRFAVADIERLRYILTAQRDEYLPLRVIKQRLDALDGRAGWPGPRGAGWPAEHGWEGPADPAPETMTRSELLEAAGADEALLSELEDYGLIRRTRHYAGQTLDVVRCAVSLREFGIQPRHLRAVKAAAEREVSLVEQVAAPLQRHKGSREPAQRVARNAAAHIARLHATLVEGGLNEAGLASGPVGAGTYHVPRDSVDRAPAGREIAARDPGLREAAQGLRSASGR
jgi:DNA-binding transcriptional MerR regulator